MSLSSVQEARRQIEICNACRYCEGYCSVFPAIIRKRVFSDGDITQLANLCHNCRGCYYACQYTEPHEFALNVPAALAKVRRESWENFIWPQAFGRLFQRSGIAIMVLMILVSAILFAAVANSHGEDFYAIMPHKLMVVIFAPMFLLPLAVLIVGMRRYWKFVGGRSIRFSQLLKTARMAAQMTDLSGGQGQGCNFEKDDRYSNARRWFHQMVLFGFLLCFAATSVATIIHYMFDLPAPYDLISPPKLLGVPGGLLLIVGTIGLAYLKSKADKHLGDLRCWSSDMAFILLLFIVSMTGLALYAATGTTLLPSLLALHLGSVFTLFVLIPYSKMAHGFFRFVALVRNAPSIED